MKKLVVCLAVLAMASLAHAGELTDDFEGYGQEFLGHALADSEQLDIVGKRGWVESAVDNSTGYDARVTGNWGGPHAGPGTTGIDALVMADTGYNHVAHSIGNMSVGDQVTLMFNVHATWVFGEIWIGLDTLVDNGVSANNETAMALQFGAGGGNSISYGFYQQTSGQTLGNPPSTSGGSHSGADSSTAGSRGWWTEVRMTMLHLAPGTSTWGIDSALVETRNITAWDQAVGGNPDYAHVDGSWISLGNMNINPAGIGDGDQSDFGQTIYIGLGGEGVHMDNLVVTPEPVTMALLGMGGLTLLRRRKK